MAMSRILPQSLPRTSLRPPAPIISHLRHRSSKTYRAQVIEIDLDAGSSSQTDLGDGGPEVMTVGMKKIEEAIHSIIVRRAAPDWLPFLPGYSYWVPPPTTSLRNTPGGRMIEAMQKGRLMSEDERMAFSSTKGWPSSAYFIEGTVPEPPFPFEADEDVADEASNSQDAEE